MVDRHFVDQLQGHRLTTAKILYRMPDYPSVLQSFIWQCLDTSPRYPRLNRFLQYWIDNIDGELHKVYVAHKGLIRPADLKICDGEFRLN